MRDDQFIVLVSANGRDLGVFDTFEGGEGDSEETNYREGGGAQRPLGGRQTRGNFTVGRLYRRDRDHSIFAWLDSLRGRKDIIAKKQPLDDDNNPYGKPTTYRGRIKSVTGPDTDSNSGSNPAMLTLECTAHGDLA